MRKWKDQPQALAEVTKAGIIYLSVINAWTLFAVLLSGRIDASQLISLVAGGTLIYLMASGKFYKILKWYVERKMKKWDNKWRE